MIAPLKEEILRFESLSKNHCSIYFPSSPRANFLISFAKFCTSFQPFGKLENIQMKLELVEKVERK
jgi:hypothetical protein